MSSIADAPGGTAVRSRGLTEANVVTWLFVAFLAWVPLQTPVAVLAYQYLHVSVSVAQGILLTKDVWAAALFLILFVRHLREIRFFWFDWLALAFGVLVIVYSIVPALLGSHLPAFAVIASARELLVPVELYGLGRLGGYAGVSAGGVIKAFLVIAAGAAVFSLATFFLATQGPFVATQTFWVTTYNLVVFIHDVQGITTAKTIWDVSILNWYPGFGAVVRAVGPFTHPVGTGVYFAMPLTLAVCAVWLGNMRRKVALAIAAIGMILFALAVITPISRGTWAGFLGAVLICGLVLHKYRLAVLTAVIFAAFVYLVPPFSYSIVTPVQGTDSSTIGHEAAVAHAVEVVTSAPAGSGVGQGDQFGTQFSGGESEGVGENMYLTTYASVGPLGTLAFVVWLGALLVELLCRFRPSLPVWITVGVGTGLLAEAAGGMTASSLMRFTTAASMCLLIGLVIAQPASGYRWPKLAAAVRHPRQWLESRGTKAEAAEPQA